MDRTFDMDDTAPGHASNVSYWIESTPETRYGAMVPDTSVDVVVLGGGIAGLSTALMLKQAGRTVAVVEAYRVASSVSGYTTAKVTSQHGTIYEGLGERACAYGAANQAALQFIAQTCEEHSIECDLERLPAFVYTRDENGVGGLREEAEAAREAGLPASFTSGEIGLPFEVAGAVRFDHQAQFHPRRYLLAVAELINGDGSFVFENSRATKVDDGDPCRVETTDGVISATDVVVATHIPFQLRGEYYAKAFAHRGYVVAGHIPHEQVPAGMFITSEQPTRSVRWAHGNGRPVLMVGGEGHKTGAEPFTEERYERLEAWAREQFPSIDLKWRWSTQDFTCVDNVPLIGKLTSSSEHVYVATGFGSWGMTNGTVAAMLLRDAILGRDNDWQATFESTRTMPLLANVKQLVSENVDTVKKLVGGHLGLDRKTAESVDDLRPGDGAVIDRHAVFRDEHGSIHTVSAACTHMGCVVEWNSAETTWDCPCHGSRFTVDGDVIQGPALEPLERL